MPRLSVDVVNSAVKQLICTTDTNLVSMVFMHEAEDAVYPTEQELAVIVPTYNQPENDRQAMDIIRQAFPDREIIGIDSCTPIRQHGSLHCLTMHLPKGVLITDDSYQF